MHNLSSDQLAVALTANAPLLTNTVLANLTQISYTNLSSRNCVTTSWSQAGGVTKLLVANLVLTASGPVATFRYVCLYNSTAAAGNLIGFWDWGSNVTMVNAKIACGGAWCVFGPEALFRCLGLGSSHGRGWRGRDIAGYCDVRLSPQERRL